MLRLPLILLLGFAAAHCSKEEFSSAVAPPPEWDGKPLVVINTSDGEVKVEVEVVSAPRDRAKGLMFRKQLPAEAGMLFLMPSEEQQSFWMKNTYIPLDMMFIDSQMKIVGIIENTVPLSEQSRMVDAKSKYVLEVNAGYSKRYGITVGDYVSFFGVR